MIFASRSDRLFGQMLDALIALMPIIGIALITALGPEPIASVAHNFWLAALLLCLAYLFFSDALPGGQSFGKQMLGIAVVDQRSGRPCSAWQSFVRNLLLSILGFFDWIFIFGEQHQRLGDMAAGTIVVDAATVTAGAGAYHQ
jgi:uncharacterized RDD family membrane protein YckC